MSEPERIAKRLARVGLCSRRDAERWIAAGRVRVDGQVLETPAFVVTDRSRIEVDGKGKLLRFDGRDHSEKGAEF